MSKIIPHLWFDSQAEEAVKLYTSLFPNTKIGSVTHYTKAGFDIHGQPEGKVMTVEFELAGQTFLALNAGPIFTFTPAISFLVCCETKEEVDAIWNKLSPGGMALMELGSYPFSERYGWLQDRFGLSWQIMYMGKQPVTQKVIPTLMFVGDVCGKAEEAMKLYTSIFDNSGIGAVMRYEPGEGVDRPGTIKHGRFTLEGQEFAVMDSAYEHKFAFNEAISFLVRCDNQEEIDYYWNKLIPGGDPKAQQCGWLKDAYGVSWQISPTVLEKMLESNDIPKIERVTDAFMKMKKFDIAELEKAFRG